MSRGRVHLRAVYYLPSWQGGDVTLPLCRILRSGGYVEGPPAKMADDLVGVCCPHCIRRAGVEPMCRRRRRTAATVVRFADWSIAPIAEAIANRHGLTLAILQSPDRTARVSLARDEAFAACRVVGRASTRVIGKFFGRERSTVSDGITRHERRLAARLPEAA